MRVAIFTDSEPVIQLRRDEPGTIEFEGQLYRKQVIGSDPPDGRRWVVYAHDPLHGEALEEAMLLIGALGSDGVSATPPLGARSVDRAD